jgi:hypothetical protein
MSTVSDVIPESSPVVEPVSVPIVEPAPAPTPAPVPTVSVPVKTSSGAYTFLYGIVGVNTEDVTATVYSTCVTNNVATIPGGDQNREALFGVDPVFGYIKEVYIIDSAGTQTSYDVSVNVFVNFSTNVITTTPWQG